jgi:hypothetical protein
MRHLAATLLLALSAVAPVRAGCWVCLQIEHTPVDCSLSDQDNGGTSCINKCHTTSFGTDFCVCTTSGVCTTGTHGCGGPCPMVTEPPAEKFATPADRLARERRADGLQALSRGPGFRLEAAPLARLEKLEPLAAAVLQGLSDDDGRLQGGAFDGVVTAHAPGQLLQGRRFHARVDASPARVSFRVEFLDGDDLSAFEGELASGGAGRLQLEDRNGFPTVERW